MKTFLKIIFYEMMKTARSEREVVKLIMELKLRDERRHQYEMRKERNEAKIRLENIVKVKNRYKRIISQINGEAKKWRNTEKRKYIKKADHIRKLRLEEEERELQTCPKELEEYRDLKIFSKKEMENLIKEEVTIS